MTTLVETQTQIAARTSTQYFYFCMALSCTAVAFLGFAPTYWLPMAARTFKSNPIVHIHGLVFFCWTLFFCFQTWLAASGRIANHRSTGMSGISFATAMTIFGVLVSINLMKTAAAMGLKDEGIAFAIVPLSRILFFAVAFSFGIAAVRQPEHHKRLMLLAGRCGSSLVPYLSGAARAPWTATRRGNLASGVGRLSAARGRDRVRLAHPRAAASGLSVRWRGADRGQDAEPADQHQRVVEFLRRRNICARALA